MFYAFTCKRLDSEASEDEAEVTVYTSSTPAVIEEKRAQVAVLRLRHFLQVILSIFNRPMPRKKRPTVIELNDRSVPTRPIVCRIMPSFIARATKCHKNVRWKQKKSRVQIGNSTRKNPRSTPLAPPASLPLAFFGASVLRPQWTITTMYSTKGLFVIGGFGAILLRIREQRRLYGGSRGSLGYWPKGSWQRDKHMRIRSGEIVRST